MKHVDALLALPEYNAALAQLESSEAERRFCRHGLSHALDVARIAWIFVLENTLAFEKETIYLAALLHDIGRTFDADNHDAESARLAALWLAKIGMDAETTARICEAIGMHREKSARIEAHTATLGDILRHADKLSRPCFHCAAACDCYWPETLKNHTLTL